MMNILAPRPKISPSAAVNIGDSSIIFSCLLQKNCYNNYVGLHLYAFVRGVIVNFGLRTPSLKKSFKARTTGKLKRKIKKATNPFYSKKGMGYIKNPKRAIKNKIYHKTTFSWNNKNAWIHILLFLTTAGIGNIVYLMCKKK